MHDAETLETELMPCDAASSTAASRTIGRPGRPAHLGGEFLRNALPVLVLRAGLGGCLVVARVRRFRPVGRP